MINEQVLQGHWNEIKGQIRSKWGQLTNDDVQNFDGNVDRLVGLIQRKTGEGRESVERFLNEVTANGASVLEDVAENVRQYAQQAGDRIQEGTKQAAETMRQGYEKGYESVRQGYEDVEEMVRPPLRSRGPFASGAKPVCSPGWSCSLCCIGSKSRARTLVLFCQASSLFPFSSRRSSWLLKKRDFGHREIPGVVPRAKEWVEE